MTAAENAIPNATQGQEIPAPMQPVVSPAEAPARSESVLDLALPAGVSRVRLHLETAESLPLEVAVEVFAPEGERVGQQSLVFGDALEPLNWRMRLGALVHLRTETLAVWLSGLAFGIYLLTRLIALPDFPIYFFTDEAIQTMSAADLLRDHLFGPGREFLPTYFANGSQYNLSVSVYLQALPYLLFGKSIWVTRGISALMTLLAAASVWLILKRVFKSQNAWLAVLFLSVTPAWFLHSRTAFETALATSFYAGFLYCYLVYRTEDGRYRARYLFGAVGLGALAFYTYTPLRMIMLVTGLLLFLSDLRYHLRQWKLLLYAACLGLVLALPFLRFLITHPDALDWHMRLLGSYWLYDVPLLEKLGTFAGEYLRGLDPLYWYLPNTADLARHVMLGYGHLLRQTLPLGLFGLALAFIRIRNARYRTLLLAVLAAPSGAALVHLGITRALVMVIPMAILTALAADWLLAWLLRHWLKRWEAARGLLVLLVFGVLSAANGYMLWDALTNGPFWSNDYGLTGMQYGAQQVFGEIKDYLKHNPRAHVLLSPSWANGTDVIARFFSPDPPPFELGSPDNYFNQVLPLEGVVLVMIPEEYARIPRSRFAEVRLERTVNDPTGSPAFYFVRLKYVDNIEAVVAQEQVERHKPVLESAEIDGQAVQVTHTPLDMGAPGDLFPGTPGTLLRTDGINPMQLTFAFPSPRALNAILLRVGGTATTIKVAVWQPGQAEASRLSSDLPEAPYPRDVTLAFPATVQAERVQIEISNTSDGVDGHVHLWRLVFQ